MLLASAPTLDGIKECITKFYCGTQFDIQEDGTLKRCSDGKILDSVHVVKKRNRYRFEKRER